MSQLIFPVYELRQVTQDFHTSVSTYTWTESLYCIILWELIERIHGEHLEKCLAILYSQ